MHTSSLFRKVIAPFITFALLFIGAGFISGSIVHLGEGLNPWDISILTTGVILFMIGSYVQEILYNGKSFKEKDTLLFLFFSLLLSLGIGMVSGGTQHYVDTPSYSSYLIPIGILIGMFAFVLKTNINLTRREGAKLLMGTVVFCTILWLVLVYGARTIPVSMQSDDHHGKNNSVSMLHEMTVDSDQEFISTMIPHHQEAVDSSKSMLAYTVVPEQKEFLENIIDIQTKEIEQLKAWYQEFFGTPYVQTGRYQPMMSKNDHLKNNTEKWHLYIEDMIAHHKSAVTMAEQILPITHRENIKSFASKIITTQSQEIAQMNAWLGESDHHDGADKH